MIILVQVTVSVEVMYIYLRYSTPPQNAWHQTNRSLTDISSDSGARSPVVFSDSTLKA